MLPRNTFVDIAKCTHVGSWHALNLSQDGMRGTQALALGFPQLMGHDVQ